MGGSIAVPNSWPSQALVVQNYKGDYTLGGSKVTVTERFICGGTIINGYTILSAAQCIVNKFTTTINNVSYTVNVYNTNNQYYPTLASMFKVYVGAHNRTFLFTGTSPPSPTVELSVSKIINV